MINTKIFYAKLCLVDYECCVNSHKEEKSESHCIKHRIIEEMGFVLFLEYVKNLNRFKGNTGYSKQREQGTNGRNMDTYYTFHLLCCSWHQIIGNPTQDDINVRETYYLI